MTDQQPPPLSPFALTPARITLLVLGVLAVLMIAGALLGGVNDMEALKEATPSSAAASASSPAG